jgi:hypothetical protein
MNCKDVREKICEFIGNDLPLDISEQIQTHMDSCPECRRELEIYGKTWQTLDAWEDYTPSPGFKPFTLPQNEGPNLIERILSLFCFKVPAWAVVGMLIVVVFTGYFNSPQTPGYFPTSVVYVPIPLMDDKTISINSPSKHLLMPRSTEIVNEDKDDLKTNSLNSDDGDLTPIENQWKNPSHLRRVDIKTVFGSNDI